MPAPISTSHMRQVILRQSRRANVGHIGSALSVADILAALYGGVLRGAPTDPDRDRFVMSKGHAALALYAALHLSGLLSKEVLDTFTGDGTHLGVHPHHQLPGVEFSTGSLGQGLSIGAGAALAARLDGSPRRVYVLLSDAECNEGSVWEAAMFASQHRLSNLVVLVDANGQQALGYTRDVLDQEPLAERWSAFGWNAVEVDGHDPDRIRDLLEELPSTEPGRPHAVIARTVFGRGVSFMERQIAWHYLPLQEDQFQAALDEVGAGEERA